MKLLTKKGYKSPRQIWEKPKETREMKTRRVSTLALLLLAAFCTACLATGASGADLAERYTNMRDQLKAELTAQLPAEDQAKGAELEAFLASDALDAKFAKYVVLSEATPEGLAEYARQGKEQAAWVEKLLADADLMKQMLVADGANGGKYGPAMQIYSDIQRASKKASTGLFQRLALAVALEHSVPVRQTNPKTETDAPATVAPVARYLHFEKAYLDGELDPAFDRLSVWELRKVVNGDEPDDILTWGREMLRNFRPDHIYTSNHTPKHEVTITKGFYMGKYEVTQAQFQHIMGSNPSRGSKDPNSPADNISEADAFKFCADLSAKVGRDVRLPTEAEWEYACRAGTDTKYFFGDSPEKYGEFAWFQDNDGGKSHPVGQKKPNPWGLYDIYGNVWERVSDRFHKDYYAQGPKVDPTGFDQGRHSQMEYQVNAPKAGTYELTAEVCTANYEQLLSIAVGDAAPVVLEMPFTLGSWTPSDPVKITLKEGENTLRLWRDNPPQYGMAIKKVTLKPVK